jgi:hypothetical protein
MAKNRKYQSAAIRFGPAVKAFLLIMLIGGSGVGYVWQKKQIIDLGVQITEREHRLTGLENQNDQLKMQLARMRSRSFLEARIKQLNLGLMPPQASQIWLLQQPLAAPPPLERQYALQARSAVVP